MWCVKITIGRRHFGVEFIEGKFFGLSKYEVLLEPQINPMYFYASEYHPAQSERGISKKPPPSKTRLTE